IVSSTASGPIERWAVIRASLACAGAAEIARTARAADRRVPNAGFWYTIRYGTSSMSTSASSVGAHVLEPSPRFSLRQEEVLDGVERVFVEKGIRGVRIGDLATAASCSRSTLYELAESKEDLLLLVLDRMMRRIMRRGAEAIARASEPVDRVKAMVASGALDL